MHRDDAHTHGGPSLPAGWLSGLRRDAPGLQRAVAAACAPELRRRCEAVLGPGPRAAAASDEVLAAFFDGRFRKAATPEGALRLLARMAECRALWEGLRAGDPQAARWFWEQWGPRVRAMCRQRLGDGWWVQDAVDGLLAEFAALRGPRISQWQAMWQYLRLMVRTLDVKPPSAGEDEDPPVIPVDPLRPRDPMAVARLQRCMERLGDTEQRALALRYGEGRAWEEISTLWPEYADKEQPRANAYARVKGILRKLRRCMEEPSA